MSGSKLISGTPFAEAYHASGTYNKANAEYAATVEKINNAASRRTLPLARLAAPTDRRKNALSLDQHYLGNIREPRCSQKEQPKSRSGHGDTANYRKYNCNHRKKAKSR